MITAGYETCLLFYTLLLQQYSNIHCGDLPNV